MIIKSSPTIHLLSKPHKLFKKMPGGTSLKPSASATVEAVCIFPFIILFFISVIWMMDLFYIHSEIGALVNTLGNEMVAYSFPATKLAEGDDSRGLISLALKTGWTEGYIKSEIKKLPSYEKINYLSALLSGHKTDGEIDIVVTYYVKPYISIPGISGVLLTNHFYSKSYIGYEGKKVDDSTYVYVTKTGEVYHTCLDCNSLKSNPKGVFINTIKKERNKDGSCYYPCEFCGNNFRSIVYITEYGNRYHVSPSCPQIKIDIFQIPLSKVGNRRKCIFCRKRESE